MTRKPRNLRPEERELWDKVARNAEPLHKRPAHPVMPEPTKPNPGKHVAPKMPISPFRLGDKSKPKPRSHDLAPSLATRLSQAPVTMDHKAFGKMKRGKMVPEGKLDLHGLTLADAHPELIDFIMDAYNQGKRLVLVVTGKGKHRDTPGPIPVPFGVLKHQVPMWLNMPPLRAAVLQITEAHLRHGGEGAYYVYLRRHR